MRSGGWQSLRIAFGKALAEVRSDTVSVGAWQGLAKSHPVPLHQVFALGDHALTLGTDRFSVTFALVPGTSAPVRIQSYRLPFKLRARACRRAPR